MIALAKRYVGLFLLVIGVVGMVIVNFTEVKAESQVQVFTTIDSTITTSTTTFSIVEAKATDYAQGNCHVDVKGAVRYPGVYLLPQGSRIEDALMAAGGAKADADLDGINLARYVSDQMVVFVPTTTADSESEKVANISVDIKGEVHSPGVYAVAVGTRIYQVIALAGGVTEQANTDTVNMSLIVVDEMMIVIPGKSSNEADVPAEKILVQINGEVMNPRSYYVTKDYTLLDLIKDAGGLTPNADIRELDLDKQLYSGYAITIPSYHEAEVGQDNEEDEEAGLVNINSASLEELMTLKGIGMVLGQRIIDYRAEYGSFLAIEDVMHVSGIKESIYEDICEFITVGNG